MLLNEIYFHQEVMTPNGPGLVQGRFVDADKSISIIVSHDPKLETIPAEIRAKWRGVIWILINYPPEMLEPMGKCYIGTLKSSAMLHSRDEKAENVTLKQALAGSKG
jgi:hypothetical protein